MFGAVLMFSLFFTTDSIQIGKIENRILMGISTQLLSNTTQNQCICEMAKLSGSILAMNYFQINNTCQLFIPNNNSLVVQYYSNSSVLFYNQSFVSIIVQPLCDPNCQNNGTCSFTGLCICTPQWSVYIST